MTPAAVVAQIGLVQSCTFFINNSFSSGIVLHAWTTINTYRSAGLFVQDCAISSNESSSLRGEFWR